MEKQIKKTSKKVNLAAALGLTSLCVALVQVDLAPHRKALQDLAQDDVSKSLSQQSEDLSAELTMFSNCASNKSAEDTGKPLVEYRECLLAAMPKVKTEGGASIFGLVAAYWIEANPNDTEVKKAALKTLDAGWADLRQKIPLYDLMDKIASAHNNSIILRALQGPQSNESNFERRTSALERVELRLKTPVLMQAQANRRFSFIK